MLKIFQLFCFCTFILYSCSTKEFDEKSLAIVPVENIQVPFDLVQDTKDKYKNFVNSHGNVFEIINMRKLEKIINRNRKELLLTSNYFFLWDTTFAEKKLYLIDHNKTFFLNVQKVKKTSNSDEASNYELILSAKTKVKLSSFFAQHIGLGLVMNDKNGFVTSAEKIKRLENGNLMIQH